MQNKKIILRPVFTEKTMQLVTNKKYVFEVMRASSKTEIASAIKGLFDVDVQTVRTMIRPGKQRRVLRTRKYTRTAPRKFAVVSLKEGQSIAGFDKLLEVEDAN